jgi:hypothetical protein
MGEGMMWTEKPTSTGKHTMTITVETDHFTVIGKILAMMREVDTQSECKKHYMCWTYSCAYDAARPGVELPEYLVAAVDPVAAADPVEAADPVTAADPVAGDSVAATALVSATDPVAAADPVAATDPVTAADLVTAADPVAAAISRKKYRRPVMQRIDRKMNFSQKLYRKSDALGRRCNRAYARYLSLSSENALRFRALTESGELGRRWGEVERRSADERRAYLAYMSLHVAHVALIRSAQARIAYYRTELARRAKAEAQ